MFVYFLTYFLKSRFLSKMLVQEAPAVWHSLKGLICIYKPSEVSAKKLREILIHKICQGPTTFITIKGNFNIT